MIVDKELISSVESAINSMRSQREIIAWVDCRCGNKPKQPLAIGTNVINCIRCGGMREAGKNKPSIGFISKEAYK